MSALMKRYAFTMMMALMGCLTSCAEEDKKPKAEVKDIRIVLETSKGKIEATIYASKVPMTAANYLNLAKRGYYDGIKFHLLSRHVLPLGCCRRLLGFCHGSAFRGFG